MRRNAIILLALAVLAGLLAYLLWPRATPAPAGEAAAAASPEEVIAQRRAARQALPTDTRQAALGGRIADEGGAAIAGAMVSVGQRSFSLGNPGTPGAPTEPMVAISDEAGRWRVAGVPPGRYTVSATAPGYLPGRLGGVLVDAGAERDDVDLTLRQGGASLRGVVSDIGGGPIGGALVRATALSEGSLLDLLGAPLTTMSDDEGRYAMQLPDGFYALEVVHPDYQSAYRTTEGRGGERVEDFTMTPGAMIFGRVLRRGDEAPVAGAKVTHQRAGESGGAVVSGFGPTSVTTDGEGRFAVRGLGSGTIELRAFGRGYASREATTVQLGIAEQVDGVILFVDGAYTISGFVVEERDASRAVADVLVGAFNFSPGAVHLARDASADDGFFEILGVQPGSYVVGAAGEEHVVNVMGASVQVVDRDVDDVLVRLESGATLSGRVEPPRSATIAIEIDPETIGIANFMGAIKSAVVRGRAGDDGRFVLRAVPPGSMSLVATADDGATGSLAVEVGDDDQDGLVIALEERSYLAGVVVDDDGAAVQGVRVNVEARSQRRGTFNLSMIFGAMGGVTNADGSFRVVGLEPGAYAVTVSDGRTQLQWADRRRTEPALEPLEVTIEGAEPKTGLRLVVEARKHDIRGLVLGPDGAPVPDAWVTASLARRAADADGSDEPVTEQRRNRRRGGGGSSGGGGGAFGQGEPPVLTGADGRFVIQRLREGSYDLEAEGLRGDARGAREGVRSGSDVVLRLEQLAGIRGALTDRSGRPVTQYLLEVRGPTFRRTQVINPEGAYLVARLDPGSYDLSVIAPEGRAAGTVEVRKGQIADKRLELVAWGSVFGVVVDQVTGEPMPELVVIANTDEGTDVGDMALAILSGDGPRTDEAGRFRVGRLGAGAGNLVVVDADQSGFEIVAQRSFTLQPGQDLDLGTISGRAVDTVPRDERGDLGLATTAATWESRPRGEDGASDEPPAGLDPEREHLWVVSVAPDGPAAAAGVAAGDRIVAIGPVPIDAVGPVVGAQLLAPRRIRAGQTVELSIARGAAAPTTATITARPTPADG